MAIPPRPMPTPGPGGGPPVGPGIGLPKSPIGGPSGPGSSPMVSPGTGAGMQARAVQSIKKMVENLLAESKSFEVGTKQHNAIISAVKVLNPVFTTSPEPEAQKMPIPVPPTAPGGGLGGVGLPPTGLPTGGGAPPEL